MFRSSPFVPEHTKFKMYRNTNLVFVDPCLIVQFIKENPTRCNNVSKFYFVIPYLNEAQHVSGDTPPIIRSLKLHWQPLVLHTWKIVGRVDSGRCQTHCEIYTGYVDCLLANSQHNLYDIYILLCVQW